MNSSVCVTAADLATDIPRRHGCDGGSSCIAFANENMEKLGQARTNLDEHRMLERAAGSCKGCRVICYGNWLNP